MVKVVAFDLWDTLIYLEKSWKTFTQLKPFIARDENFWRQKVKPLYLFRQQKSPESFLEDLRKSLGIDLRNLAPEMHKQLDYDLKHTKVYPDVFSTLEVCKKKGKKLAVMSNQCSFYVPSFYSLGLNKYFDFVLFSCNLGYGKPDERIYRKLIDITRTDPSNILIVGDHRNLDYQRPLELGFKAVHLSRNAESSDSSIKTLDGIASKI